MKASFCGHCRRNAPGERAPRGWYNLTVNVPESLDKRGRGYIYLGIFCSLKCLAAHFPEFEKQDDETLDLYPRD